MPLAPDRDVGDVADKELVDVNEYKAAGQVRVILLALPVAAHGLFRLGPTGAKAKGGHRVLELVDAEGGRGTLVLQAVVHLAGTHARVMLAQF